MVYDEMIGQAEIPEKESERISTEKGVIGGKASDAADRNADRKVRIARLRENLASLRKLAGWTAAVLAEKIDVSKQTISNIESSNGSMSYVQYLAVRAVLQAEIIRIDDESKDLNIAKDDTLGRAVYLMVDDDSLSAEDYQKAREAVAIAAASKGIAEGPSRDMFKTLVEAMAPAAIAVFAAAIILWAWTKKK